VESGASVEEVARHQLQEIVPSSLARSGHDIIGQEATKRNNTPLSFSLTPTSHVPILDNHLDQGGYKCFDDNT
jgi:hypothetical protein